MPVRFFLSSLGNAHRLNNLLSFLALLIRVFPNYYIFALQGGGMEI